MLAFRGFKSLGFNCFKAFFLKKQREGKKIFFFFSLGGFYFRGGPIGAFKRKRKFVLWGLLRNFSGGLDKPPLFYFAKLVFFSR